MPLCPQVTITPITVTTTGMTTASVIAANAPATTEQLIAVDADAAAAAAAAAVAAAEAATALSTANAAQTTANAAAAEAATSLQVSSNTIVNASNQLTAINGNGVTVYAGASASSGARVVLNSSGITGFNSGGTATFAVDANNGNVSVTGTVNATSGYFGTPSNGWSISSTGLTAVGAGNITGGSIVGSQFTSIGGVFSVSTAGFLTATSGLIGGWSISSSSISKTVGTRTTTLNSSNGLISIVDSSTAFLSGGAITIGTPSITNQISSAGMTIGSVVTFDVLNEFGGYSGIPRIYTGSGNYIRLVPNAGLIQNAYPVYVEGPLEVLGRIVGYGAINLPNIASTSSAANVRWTTGGTGQLQYVTSSTARIKDNITNIINVPGLDPKALLDLPVRAFTYKHDYLSVDDDRFDVLVPGFIAEEVDAVYPIAADYDENGPISWNDRLMIPGLLALIQDLYKEIKILKGGIDE